MIQLEDKLYTSTEVANVLGVSLRSVYRYLEEGKLDAEVKTATGRHRFSKKNILDFLYPTGQKEEKTISAPHVVQKEDNVPVVKKTTTPRKVKTEEVTVEPTEEEVEEFEETKPTKKHKVKEVEEPAESTESEEEKEKEKEEPIDWLAKFREAAKKYKEEAEKSEPTEDSTPEAADTISSFGEAAFEEEEAPAKTVKSKGTKKNYFRSNLGGLKDIAQNIDKGSRNSFLDYAFTMNAGLSLYKPIKPFSMLHSYVRETDLPFFEKLLGLTPTDETNAQLCLLVTNDDKAFNSKEELHGLFVVSKDILYKDIQEMGDSALIAEAASILK